MINLSYRIFKENEEKFYMADFNEVDMNILLVEDNPIISKGLKYSFEQNGFHFIYASKVEEAKKILQETKEIDLAILDIGLPDGDGLELFERYMKPIRNSKFILNCEG